MLCPHCREPLPQRSRFCPKCGFLCVVEQPGPITQPSQPASSAGQQAMPIPRVSSAPTQPAAQAAMRQQSSGVPVPQLRNNCPRCGADIDLESGRCSGCGLLYGIRHRAIQQQAASTASARPPLVPRPQTPAVQQPPAARGMMPQYGSPQHSPPPSFGQRQNYGSPGAMPGVGMQLPIPSAAPAAAGAISAGLPPPTLAAKPYPYQAAPPAPGGRGIPAAGRQGLPGIATIIIALIVCLFIGGGIYYFINQGNTSSPTDDIVYSTPPSIQNTSTSSITETGATITWKTDKPTTGKVEYWKNETDVQAKLSDGDLSTSHNVTLTGLEPGTTYKYTIISIDADGNEATLEKELTTLAAADETPPVISGVSYSNVTESSAIITWMTNELATSQVEYGETEEYESKTTEISNLTTDHSVTLTGLDDGKTYNFQAISKDSSGNEATSTNQTFETPVAIPFGSQVYNRAPDFTVQNLDGEDVDIKLSDFRGKIVMINFWATWCIPCTQEMPHIQAVFEDWTREDLTIIAIASNTSENIDTVNEFIEDEGYTFPVFYDSEGQAKSLYSIQGWPTTFFIDAEGIIRYIQFKDSFDDQAEIEDILDSL